LPQAVWVQPLSQFFIRRCCTQSSARAMCSWLFFQCKIVDPAALKGNVGPSAIEQSPECQMRGRVEDTVAETIVDIGSPASCIAIAPDKVRAHDFLGDWETDAGGRFSIVEHPGEEKGAIQYVEEDLPMTRLTGTLVPSGDWLETSLVNEVDAELIGQLRLKFGGHGILSWFRPPTEGAEWYCSGQPATKM